MTTYYQVYCDHCALFLGNDDTETTVFTCPGCGVKTVLDLPESDMNREMLRMQAILLESMLERLHDGRAFTIIPSQAMTINLITDLYLQVNTFLDLNIPDDEDASVGILDPDPQDERSEDV